MYQNIDKRAIVLNRLLNLYFSQLQDILGATHDFENVLTDATTLLDGFSGDFVSNYTGDINKKLDDISKDIREEVALA
jgi:hypothetical protein